MFSSIFSINSLMPPRQNDEIYKKKISRFSINLIMPPCPEYQAHKKKLATLVPLFEEFITTHPHFPERSREADIDDLHIRIWEAKNLDSMYINISKGIIFGACENLPFYTKYSINVLPKSETSELVCATVPRRPPLQKYDGCYEARFGLSFPNRQPPAPPTPLAPPALPYPDYESKMLETIPAFCNFITEFSGLSPGPEYGEKVLSTIMSFQAELFKNTGFVATRFYSVSHIKEDNKEKLMEGRFVLPPLNARHTWYTLNKDTSANLYELKLETIENKDGEWFKGIEEGQTINLILQEQEGESVNNT